MRWVRCESRGSRTDRKCPPPRYCLGGPGGATPLCLTRLVLYGTRPAAPVPCAYRGRVYRARVRVPGRPGLVQRRRVPGGSGGSGLRQWRAPCGTTCRSGRGRERHHGIGGGGCSRSLARSACPVCALPAPGSRRTCSGQQGRCQDIGSTASSAPLVAPYGQTASARRPNASAVRGLDSRRSYQRQ